MNILENLFHQYLYITKDVLKKRYGENSCKGVILSLEEEYLAIFNSNSTQKVIPKDINQKMHVVTPCFVIALYRTLKKDDSISISLENVKDIMMEIFHEFVGPLAEMQKNRLKNSTDKWEKFKESTIFGTNNTYSSFKPELIRNDSNVLEFHLKECVFFDVFKAHGELSIAPLLCFYDDIFSEAVEEWISFERPKTIADGADYCQFCYNLKKSNSN